MRRDKIAFACRMRKVFGQPYRDVNSSFNFEFIWNIEKNEEERCSLTAKWMNGKIICTVLAGHTLHFWESTTGKKAAARFCEVVEGWRKEP